MSGNLLLIALLLPVAGAITITVGARLGRNFARWTALLTTLATAFLAFAVMASYEGGEGFHAHFDANWLAAASGGVDIRFTIGFDGLSVWLVKLSALLLVTAVLVSWEAIDDGAPGYYALLLLLETGMLGVGVARDVILFYVFFEFTLIPLFFLIGIWGSEQRRYAANKFFLYTFAGSVLTFLGLLAIVWSHYSNTKILTFSIAKLQEGLTDAPIAPEMQLWVFLALFAGFAIKVPVVPLHTWLPLAHVQAPTAVSVLLAGVLLKIGTYGFIRFSVPMLPEATAICTPWILWLAVIGILYGALVAMAQSDIKRLIAYSSVSHMGFCMLGIFALNSLGMEGGVLQMVNHGISTGALFAIVGMLYERYHTREIGDLGGLAKKLPLLSLFMLIFTMSSIGLPGLNGFAGEFLILLGMFQRAWAGAADLVAWQLRVISVLAVFGVVLGAWYMLWLVQRVFFGPLKEPAGSERVRDLSTREVCALAPLAVFVFWIGLAPQFFFRRMEETVNPIATQAGKEFDKYYDRLQLEDQRVPAPQDGIAATSVRPQLPKPIDAAIGGTNNQESAATARDDRQLAAVDEP